MVNVIARKGKSVDVRAAIAAERRELADLLDTLRTDQWDERSLCAGWRVRDVAAHMSMGFRLSLPTLLGELVKARGNVHRMTDRVARRDAAAHSPAELANFLRDNAHHPWTPPVGGFRAALGHDVVHGLDITVALGLGRRVPEERLRILLDDIRPSSLRFFGADLHGVRLCAEDLDWSYGSGSPLVGAAQDLLLVAYGRGLPEGRLRGEPSARFTRFGEEA
ncbi:maleylpyruvate isomerase family mycothiol-dependent enzyme [Streptomyces sp. WAC05374]|uniref:maleylpyruvate isomerase family mycothiol-dependent enzyme n=1 Tax=Streptomyces sp. WAC05374 TaxID=2487420 RepID=UPI000F872D96|nr:maleylpyruvate isomerase family mycothiol-dependent enzyme [Streptomyces sp. WAC05374]RST13711.1 maleylpyruvate isomerase family mycothiol-dependent enzyme [Streptomyces sp. WAC05374]TDF54735.1 maleylpyruvate isomerase family mycothiol-dependent enzyme [Streptomyces sp. WAC05374]TDF56371.1 maleylpyruvate isomerase family mycothiol-dependent enzyme [Streptomyces sp. WAC05374]